MPECTLSSELTQTLLAHLDEESSWLRRVQEVSKELTVHGTSGEALAVQQSRLNGLLEEMQQLQSRRRTLQCRIAEAWNCQPDEVRLSQSRWGGRPVVEAFHNRRRAVLEQAAQTSAVLNVTRNSLSMWHVAVTSVLNELLAPIRSSDRYSATGQLVPGSSHVGIEMRS